MCMQVILHSERRCDLKNKSEILIQKISDALFFAGTSVLAINVILSFQSVVSVPNSVDNAIKLLAFIMLLIRYLLVDKKIWQWLTYTALILICAYTSIVADRYVLMITIMTVVGLGNMPIDTFLKKILTVETIAVLTVAAISIVLYISGDTSFLTDKQGTDYFSFGFGHSNVFSAIVFGLLSIWVFINYNKMGSFYISVLIVAAFIILFAAGTKTIFFNMIIMTVLIVIHQLNNKHLNKIVKHTAMFIFPVTTILLVLAILNYWQWGIDDLRNMPVLSTLFGRIGLGAYAYEQSGWTFLGERITYLGKVPWDSLWRRNWFTFDNTYTTLLIQYGIFYSIIISVCMYKLAKKYDYKYSLLIITWALSCLTEGYQLNCYIGTVLLTIGLLFSSGTNSMNKTGEEINETKL